MCLRHIPLRTTLKEDTAFEEVNLTQVYANDELAKIALESKAIEASTDPNERYNNEI